jgi:hypothetical protein
LPILAGTTYNAAGTPLAGATVRVFDASSNVLVASGTSNGSGIYSIATPDAGPYYAVAYLDGSPDVAGTTVNTLTSVAATPVLAWDGDTADATPDFTINFDEVFVGVGATITLEIASDSGFTSIVQTVSDTLDSGEVSAGQIGAAVSALPNGTYYARAKDSVGNTWSSTVTVTIAADVTPNAFTFTDVSSATPSTQYTSNTITVAGITGVAVVSITGGTYSKNGGGYTSAAGTAVNGDTFAVRHTSSASASTATNTVLTIGGVSDTYTTTTAAAAADGIELEGSSDLIELEASTDTILQEAA